MSNTAENLRLPVLEIDSQRKVSFANDAFCAMFGLDRAKVIGTLCLASAGICTDCNGLCPLDSVLSGAVGEVVFRRTAKRANGAAVDLEVRASGNGSGGMTLIMIDVTEAQRTEDSIARYAEGLSVLHEISDYFLGSDDMQGAISKALLLIGEYYEADLTNVMLNVPETNSMHFLAGTGWDNISEADRSVPVLKNGFAGKCLIDHCPVMVTDFDASNFERSDLYLRNNVNSGFCVPMSAGDKVIGVMGVLWRTKREIKTSDLWYLTVLSNTLAVYVEKERSFEELRRSEAFLGSVLEGIGDGVIVLDRDYGIIKANKTFLNKHNLKLGEVLNEKCYRISHRLERPCFETGENCTAREVFETGRSCTALHSHYTAAGDVFYVQTSAYPIISPSGKLDAVVETIVDVTERIKLEKDLEKRVRELEEFYDMAVGRELKMIELKDEIARLKEEVRKYGGRG